MDSVVIALIGIQSFLFLAFVCALLKYYIIPNKSIKKGLQQWIDESDGDI